MRNKIIVVLCIGLFVQWHANQKMTKDIAQLKSSLNSIRLETSLACSQKYHPKIEWADKRKKAMDRKLKHLEKEYQAWRNLRASN